MNAQEALARQMPEADLEANVESLLNVLGWTWHHETDSRRSRAGFPDIVAVHPTAHRIAFIELKSHKGRVTPDQDAWLTAAEAAGAETYVWRPIHLLDGTIRRTLWTH